MMRIRERERVYNIISWRWRQRLSRRRRWSARQLFVPLGRRFCRDTRQNPCHRVHDYDYGHDEDEDDEKKGARTHSLTRVLYIAVYIPAAEHAWQTTACQIIIHEKKHYTYRRQRLL